MILIFFSKIHPPYIAVSLALFIFGLVVILHCFFCHALAYSITDKIVSAIVSRSFYTVLFLAQRN